MKKMIFLIVLIISLNNLFSQPVEDWELIYDGTNASEFKTNISPRQLRVLDNKHFGFIDGARIYGGYTNSLTLSDSNYKSQFKALEFKYPDSIWVIVEDWNYVNENVIYVLADSCKIRKFDGINTFYYFKAFLLKSEDGGKNWSNIPINENWRTHPSNALSMFDSINGIIVQFPNQEDTSEKTDRMWITIDGWKTKNSLNLNSKMLGITNLKYLKPSFVVAKNLTNSEFISKDNGANWEVNAIPKDIILNSIDYFNFYILDENIIYFTTSNNSQIDGYNRSIIAKTTNSGKNWDKLYDKNGADSGVIGLSFVNDSTFYTHGLRIQYTTDNGKNWVDKSKDYAGTFDTPVASFNILPDGDKVALTYLKIYSTKSKTSDIFEYFSAELSISPNPASDYIEINAGNRHACSLQQEIRIYNTMGEWVLTLTPALSQREKVLRIDVSGLAAGVYFVRVGDRTGLFVKY